MQHQPQRCPGSRPELLPDQELAEETGTEETDQFPKAVEEPTSTRVEAEIDHETKADSGPRAFFHETSCPESRRVEEHFGLEGSQANLSPSQAAYLLRWLHEA